MAGEVTSDRTLEELRQAVSYDATERRGRYYAAMVSGPSSLESVLRLVDAEVGDDRKTIERVREIAQVWETLEPQGLMSRRRAAAILLEVIGQ